MNLPVTRTFMPPWEEFEALLQPSFASAHLTNHGPLVERLELQLAKHLGVREVVCVANGTLALWAALVAAGVGPGDEVVVPAFTYVATAAAVRLCGAVPVLADVDPLTLCLDPLKAEEAITDLTTAILPVHVYGTPCEMNRLGGLSTAMGIQVIYDAAHAFASGCFEGRVSALSFHATKLFHSAEGGAVATDDADMAQRVRLCRNFGHRGPYQFEGFGVNAKMSELHAAMGLAVLPHLPEILQKRRAVVDAYDKALPEVAPVGGSFSGMVAYYPIRLRDDRTRTSVVEALEAAGIHPRRYFSPCLSALSWCVQRGPLLHAAEAADRILCLPLSHDMTPEDARLVAGIVMEAIR